MSLNNFEETSTRRVLLYGVSGAGKTTLAATLARSYNLIWIDTENGASTLKKLPPEHKANIEFYRIPDSISLPVAVLTIYKLFKHLKGSICAQHGAFDCPRCKASKLPMQSINLSNLNSKTDIVVLDSLSQVGISSLAYAMKDAEDEMEKPERDDYGKTKKYTENIGSSIQNAPFNLVAISHALDVEIEKPKVKGGEGKYRKYPQFGSSTMSQNIGARFDDVVYMEIHARRHRAFSSSVASNDFYSKSRTGWMIESEATLDLVPSFDDFLATAKQEQEIPVETKIAIAKTAPLISGGAQALGLLRRGQP